MHEYKLWTKKPLQYFERLAIVMPRESGSFRTSSSGGWFGHKGIPTMYYPPPGEL